MSRAAPRRFRPLVRHAARRGGRRRRGHTRGLGSSPPGSALFLPPDLGTSLRDELLGEAHLGWNVGEAAPHSLQDGLSLFQYEPLALDRSEKHIPGGEAQLPAELRRYDQSSLRSHGHLGRMSESFHGLLI